MKTGRFSLCDIARINDIRGPKNCLWVLFILACAVSGLPIEEIPKSLKSNSGYYCFVRCLAQCIGQHGTGALDGECHQKCSTYNDDNLCAKSDTNCWHSCKNSLQVNTASIPQAPQNVTVAYVTTPQPTPWEANVRWTPVDKAQLYVIQNVDETDSFKTWANGGLSMNVTTSNLWRFVKPSLCPEYAFRVASVNEYGVSGFSEIVNLSEPSPVVPAAMYSIRSAEMLNLSFSDLTRGDSPMYNPVYNTTVKLVISFAPPPNWVMTKEITKVDATFHVINCDKLKEAFSPLLRQRAGEPEFDVLLPGAIAESPSECKMLFTVNYMVTKCDPRVSIPYPETFYDAASGTDQHAFNFALSCKNIRHSVCPYSAISVTPSCGVKNINLKFSTRENHSSLINATAQFDQVLVPKDAQIKYYWVRYGEFDKPDTPVPLPVMIANITRNVGYLKVDNGSNTFELENLDVHKSYAVQICAVYWDTPVENLTWQKYVFYPLDLSRFAVDTADPDKSHTIFADSRFGTYVAAVAVPIVVALLVAMAVFTFIVLRYRRVKSIDELKIRPAGWDDDRYIIMPNKVDKWEIDRQNLIIYEDQKLGSGAFGSVFKCKVIIPLQNRSNSGIVLAENWSRFENGEAAVKLLPEYADETSKSDFRQEINLMKNLGHHERLVNMIGCVTATEPLCLVVEYCQDGDLLHYLRDRRNYMIELEAKGIDLNNLTEQDEVNMGLILCFKDLLSFAWQISVGLEYLSQKGYIHRDVAARNVLVDRGKKAKIGDFGLCRYSYDDSVYLSHGGRLPLKWMALEAIKHYEFTTKSDVWSYGVLLFEIITMGGNPYPGLQPADLEAYLEAGNRMEQPDNCPPILYTIMLECWRKLPSDRPTFTQLRESLRLLLEEVTLDYSYMNLNAARDYYNVIPSEYPSLATAIQQQPPSRAGSTKVAEKDSSDDVVFRPPEAHAQQKESSESDDFSQDKDSTRSDSISTPGAATPGAVITGVSHRDSASSDQLLITPTTPKFKFFKFKPNTGSKSALAALPEGSSDNTTDGASDGRAYTNGTYVEDPLPNAAVVYES